MVAKKKRGQRRKHNAVVACAGASSVGQMANELGRRLQTEGRATFYCLSGVAARTPDVLVPVSAAAQVLVLDGCPNGCARVIMDNAGLTGYSRLVLTELGIEKERVFRWTQGNFDNALDVCRALLEGPEPTRRGYIKNGNGRGKKGASVDTARARRPR